MVALDTDRGGNVTLAYGVAAKGRAASVRTPITVRATPRRVKTHQCFNGLAAQRDPTLRRPATTPGSTTRSLRASAADHRCGYS